MMKQIIKIFADFHNSDTQGRVRLNTNGAFEDIERMKIELKSGLEVMLDNHEDLFAYGIVQFSQEENIWVVEIDKEGIRQY
jgi:hypothetical protein